MPVVVSPEDTEVHCSLCDNPRAFGILLCPFLSCPHILLFQKMQIQPLQPFSRDHNFLFSSHFHHYLLHLTYLCMYSLSAAANTGYSTFIGCFGSTKESSIIPPNISSTTYLLIHYRIRLIIFFVSNIWGPSIIGDKYPEILGDQKS